MTISFDGEQPDATTASRPPTASRLPAASRLPTPEPAPHRVRVTTPPPVTATPLEMGDADSTRQRVQLTTRYVARDGEPWIPVMGEYHFSRDRPEHWLTELRKMKSGGIDVVATYMIWIIHEEVEGEIRWDGNRDIRRFIELADEAGLKVVLRIGPWAHGEARNGGFPDWLQALPIAHRSNDPAYLDLARRWYAGIEAQVRGLFHTPEHPAGPIIGIQVDNELYDNGPHLAALREMAEEVGMSASLWTATGWGGAELPYGRVLPVYAGYSDGFWEESTTDWPAFGVTHFTFNTVRDDLTVGADLRDAPAEVRADASLGADDPWPFATCELGGGMTNAYHRRPLVDSDDVAALALTKIGSGSAWQGYYMYHGGLQVLGRFSGTHESHATGYPNDTPIRDYDFFAPLGAAGTQRAHFHKLRRQHLFLDAFGSQVAPSPAVIPDRSASGPRWAVRGDGDRGFLFANNHQPAAAALDAVHDVRFAVEFDHATVTIPSTPVDLKSGDYFVWPLRQAYGSISALTVTAQPVTELTVDGRTVVVFATTPGIDVELQLEGVDPGDISGAIARTVDGVVFATPQAAPGLASEVRVGDTTLVFLDAERADAVWRGRIDGRESIVIWPGTGWFDGGFRVELAPSGGAVDVFPPLRSDDADEIVGEGSVFRRYVLPAAPGATSLAVPDFDGTPVVPLRTAGSSNRLSAPTDDDFADAAEVRLSVPAEALAHERPLLELDWIGDVARVYIGDRLITDQFWHGRTLEVDLGPYADDLVDEPLVVTAFAWSPTSGVHVDRRVRPVADQPILEIRSAVVRPRETVVVR